MAEEDKAKMGFTTHWGTYAYDVMSFDLKNARATYQRAMVTLFHDLMHKKIEVYLDDMIAKSRTPRDHLIDLRKLFKHLIKCRLRLNPNKCIFGANLGKLLGLIVSQGGIEVDLTKVQAIRNMPALKTKKLVRSFLGRINYIARFIVQLTATCNPMFKLLKNDTKIEWTDKCQVAFDKIKQYLLNPSILVPSTTRHPLILYLAVQKASMGCMLGQLRRRRFTT